MATPPLDWTYFAQKALSDRNLTLDDILKDDREITGDSRLFCGRCLVCEEVKESSQFSYISLGEGKCICSEKCLFNAWSNFVDFIIKQKGKIKDDFSF